MSEALIRAVPLLCIVLFGCGQKKEPGSSPEAASELLSQATKLAAEQQVGKALGLLDKAIRIDPNRADIHLLKAGLLDRNARYSEAVVEARTAHRLAPNDATAVFAILRIGSTYLSPAEAEQLSREAVALAPDNPDAHLYLGRAILASDDPRRVPEALAPLQEASRLAPTSPAPPLDMGRAYMKLGDTTRAAGMFEAAAGLLDMQKSGPPMPVEAITDWIEMRRSASYNLSQAQAGAGKNAEAAKSARDAALWSARAAELRKIKNQSAAQPPDPSAQARLQAIARSGIAYWK